MVQVLLAGLPEHFQTKELNGWHTVQLPLAEGLPRFDVLSTCLPVEFALV